MPEYSLLRMELLRSIAPWLVAFLVCAYLSWRIGRWLLRSRPRAGIQGGQTGSATFEFTLAFPFFLGILFTTIQLALALNAKLIVDYAAFCAARSASVWISQDLGGDPPNTVKKDSSKWNKVRGAARVACTPISPKYTSYARLAGLEQRSPHQASDLQANLRETMIPGVADWSTAWLDYAGKWPYAYLYTEIDFPRASGGNTKRFSADGMLAVKVTHDFDLAVPFAGAAIGRAFGSRRYVIGAWYVPISATYAMQNWGDHEAR